MIIINIGGELVEGVKINGNGAWLAAQAEALGITVQAIVSLPDDKSAISAALKETLAKTDAVLITGGLGPTVDDLTRESVADALDLGLLINEDVLKRIGQRVGPGLTQGQKRQAEILETAQVVEPVMGLAPGQIIRKDNKTVILLPGVPDEMREMAPGILAGLAPSSRREKTLVFRFAGIREVEIEEKIREIVDESKISLLPHGYLTDLRLKTLPEKAEAIEQKISSLFKREIYAIGDVCLEDVAGRLLTERGLSLSVAESCTGGMLGELITTVSGSSAYFMGGVVSYSNKAKVDILEVGGEILEKSGEVSEETAKAMAVGCRNLFDTDYALSITGIAGPGGGSTEKPVGTVWIALSTARSVEAKKFRFVKSRRHTRRGACYAALEMLRQKILFNSGEENA